MPYFLFADMIKIIEQVFLSDLFIFGAYYESGERTKTQQVSKNEYSLSCRYIGNINTYEATVSIERLCRLGLITPKTNYRLKSLEKNDKFIKATGFQSLFPNIEPNLLGQTLHSTIIDELNEEFLKSNKRKSYGLEE